MRPDPPPPTDPQTTTGSHHIELFDRGVPFSKTVLWQLNEAFYASQGPGAWQWVPYGPTNTVLLADTYARLVYHWLCDNLNNLDLAEPLYVLEAGAGLGQFAFHFVVSMTELLAGHEQLKTLAFKYVLSDFTSVLVEMYAHNYRLEPFLQSGLMDRCVFDPQTDHTMHLQTSGQSISLANDLVNPLVVIGNYYFDTIPHDCFRVVDHQLQEVLYYTSRVVAPNQNQGPVRANQLDLKESCHKATLPYYGVPVIDAVINVFETQYEIGAFEFPIGGLRALENLSAMCNGRLLALISDKGHAQPEALERFHNDYIEFHNEGFSVGVNFMALEHYTRLKGGRCFLTRPRYLDLVTCMMDFTPAHPSQTASMSDYFFNHVLDLYNLPNQLFRQYDWVYDTQPKAGADYLKPILTLLHLNRYDPYALQAVEPYVHALEVGNPVRRQLILNAMAQVERRLFPTQALRESYFLMAALYRKLAMWPEALAMTNMLLRLYGFHVEGMMLKGNVLTELNRQDEAGAVYQECLAMMPGDHPARDSVAQLTRYYRSQEP
ncbi:MAG: hypothetical protein KC462_01955 [Cyanobacteria bacterium HKST-UBA05]|nr:hypothetical protein [Cyanobacteria bacterium HKST-UBA05]